MTTISTAFVTKKPVITVLFVSRDYIELCNNTVDWTELVFFLFYSSVATNKRKIRMNPRSHEYKCCSFLLHLSRERKIKDTFFRSTSLPCSLRSLLDPVQQISKIEGHSRKNN